MAKYIQRKLRAEFIGSDEYRPKNFNVKNYVPVIGWETRREVKNFNGVEKTIDELYLILIDDNGKLISSLAFNFKVMVDELAESDVGKSFELLRNATILLKTISERNVNHCK